MFKIADEISPLAMKIVADKNERSTRTLDAVRELAPKIRAASDEIEKGRRLPLDRTVRPRPEQGPRQPAQRRLRVLWQPRRHRG